MFTAVTTKVSIYNRDARISSNATESTASTNHSLAPVMFPDVDIT